MFKKILISFIFLTLVYPVFALEKNKETVLEETKQEIIENVDINNKLKKELKETITLIYGKQNADEIYTNVLKIAQNAIHKRPKEFKEKKYTSRSCTRTLIYEYKRRTSIERWFNGR